MPVTGGIDTITLTLEVWGADTVATLTMRDPLGVEHPADPAPTPYSGDQAALFRSQWRARWQYAMPGLWWPLWQVTGTGEGRPANVSPIAVGPAGPGADPRHTYATTVDYANIVHEAPPTDAERMLRDATAEVDKALLFAVYDVDDAGLPTDPDVTQALKLATVAVVRWWDENGWEGTGVEAQVQSASIAGVSLGFKRSNSGAVDLLGGQAREVLGQAGLLSRGPWVL
jgi:hypothetical protein